MDRIDMEPGEIFVISVKLLVFLSFLTVGRDEEKEGGEVAGRQDVG